jgi:excisionase family DNA binding protein
VTDIDRTLTRHTHERLTYSVPEIAMILGICKNKAYDLCSSNQFKIIRVGRSVRVVKPSFDSWLNEGCQ